MSSQEELKQALEREDWNGVLAHGAPLCGCGDCALRNASALAVDTALFMLEHPAAGPVSSDLAEIVLDHLP